MPWVSTAISVFREIGLGVGLDGLLYFTAIADILTFILTLAVIIPIGHRFGSST